MMSDKYILKKGRPVPVDDVLTWGRWMEKHREERIVEQETVGKYWISTVFLGLDHNMFGKGKPLLFETMVFSDDDSAEELAQERYSTLEEAKEGHKRMVKDYEAK